MSSKRQLVNRRRQFSGHERVGPCKNLLGGHPRGTQGPYEPSPRDLYVYSEFIRGRIQRDIAKELGLSTKKITKIVRKVEDWHRPKYVEDIRRLRRQHSEQLEYLYWQAMLGWERSLKDAVERTEQPSENGDAEKGESATDETKEAERLKNTLKSLKRKGQAGDSRFLQVASKILEDIRKIWGADKSPPQEDVNEIRVAGRDPAEVHHELVARFMKIVGAPPLEQLTRKSQP